MNFFFSSRRRHTRWNCDWSSDVCSSDLARMIFRPGWRAPSERVYQPDGTIRFVRSTRITAEQTGKRCSSEFDRFVRSEERRVGKECRSLWSRYEYKEK